MDDNSYDYRTFEETCGHPRRTFHHLKQSEWIAICRSWGLIFKIDARFDTSICLFGGCKKKVAQTYILTVMHGDEPNQTL